ncbi:hypothetical protein C4D60_Mb05t15700 [Musa balbisiana]|uniref:Uncharacterized protein n=1 Tax=Musa balbisiana TaxID=52838 RepID=A0A4S8JWE9_MUSBA|nr:hypothetical protein C4D60_Mb05t15700 [Musa balbisiana]
MRMSPTREQSERQTMSDNERESCNQRPEVLDPRLSIASRKCEKPRATYKKKGLRSPEEDEKLKSHINRHGHGSWSSLPAKAGECLRFRGKGSRRGGSFQ